MSTMAMLGLLAVIYLAYQAGKWQERSAAQSEKASQAAAQLAESYDRATRP